MICPVPEEQQPLNEYRALKDAFFYRWAALDVGQFVRLMVTWWLVLWAIASGLALTSISPLQQPILFWCVGCISATIVLLLPILVMISGWWHVQHRLAAPAIVYEESGWYDGQTWQKTPTEFTQDQLVLSYEVTPIVRKLQFTLLTFLALVAIHLVIWLGILH
ncbi:MAG: CGLD27 family protein [Pseudanabaenaceae cyanobacterium]|jgi:hypothetical protein